jgi:RNA polymerase sigma factor (TIGR02999 family)
VASLDQGKDDDRITRLLHRVNDDAEGAMDDLMGAVYEDLCRVAERHMVREFGRGLPGVTMEPSALVNESFLRIIKQRNKYDNRGQFFAIATKVMLRVLVDYQRRRGAAKRGGDRQRITLMLEEQAEAGRGPDTVIGVDILADALDGLEALDKRKADVVKMKVVWGLTMPQIAESLDISLATVERDWAFSKAWLAREAGSRRDQPAR